MTDRKFTLPTEFPTASPYAPGMMLRDWFAGQALAGFAANPESWPLEYPAMAKAAYSQADAMLEERNK